MHTGGRVRCESEGQVAVIRIDNPPVNTLSPEVRRGLIAALREARAASTCAAIVLLGEGRGFIAGADLDELDAGVEAPDLWDLTCALGEGRQPIVAALHGFALGGGLAVALSCDRRIATDTCMLGFPEVTLGLIPAFGATQYLTRIAGVEAALDLTITGRRIDAGTGLRLGLIDKVVGADGFEAAALSFAREIVAAGARRQPIRSRTSDRTRDLKIIGAARDAVDPAHLEAGAQIACIDAVCAAVTTTMEEGVGLEAALFAKLVRSPESQELRRRFRAERHKR